MDEPHGQISNQDMILLVTLADRAPLYPHERVWLNRVTAHVAAIVNQPAKPPEPKSEAPPPAPGPEPPPAQET